MLGAPAIEVIIVTRHRTEWLERCIRSIAASAQLAQLDPLRIRVGVNGADSRTEALLLELETELGQDRLQWTIDSVSRRPSNARNLLLESVQAEWVYFIDDDAFVPPEHFSRFLQALEQNPGAAVLGGPNLAPQTSGAFQRATEAVLSCRAGTFHSVSRYRQLGTTRSCGEESLVLCNLFVRASTLIGLERPFPDRFVCAEENSLLHLLRARGESLVHSPTLFNWHERRPSAFPLLDQVFHYGWGRSQFLMLYRGKTHAANFLPALALLFSAGSWIASAWTGRAPGLWACFFSAYLLVCLASFAVRRESETAASAAPWWSAVLFPLVHSGYGAGFIYGLLRGNR